MGVTEMRDERGVTREEYSTIATLGNSMLLEHRIKSASADVVEISRSL